MIQQVLQSVPIYLRYNNENLADCVGLNCIYLDICIYMYIISVIIIQELNIIRKRQA